MWNSLLVKRSILIWYQLRHQHCARMNSTFASSIDSAHFPCSAHKNIFCFGVPNSSSIPVIIVHHSPFAVDRADFLIYQCTIAPIHDGEKRIALVSEAPPQNRATSVGSDRRVWMRSDQESPWPVVEYQNRSLNRQKPWIRNTKIIRSPQLNHILQISFQPSKPTMPKSVRQGVVDNHSNRPSEPLPAIA